MAPCRLGHRYRNHRGRNGAQLEIDLNKFRETSREAVRNAEEGSGLTGVASATHACDASTREGPQCTTWALFSSRDAMQYRVRCDNSRWVCETHDKRPFLGEGGCECGAVLDPLGGHLGTSWGWLMPHLDAQGRASSFADMAVTQFGRSSTGQVTRCQSR